MDSWVTVKRMLPLVDLVWKRMSSISWILFLLITCGNNNVGTKKHVMETTFTYFLLFFKNVASRKFTVTCGTSAIFLLESAGLGPTEKCTSGLQMLQEGSHTLWYFLWATGGPGQGLFFGGTCWEWLFPFFFLNASVPVTFFFFCLKITKVMGKFFRNTYLVKENLLDSGSLQQNLPRVRSTHSALPPGLIIT